MAKVTLDVETFKALSSDTRLAVLRALDERRKTGTEVARDLGLNKATVHEHMQVLVAADLVRKRDDEGRKWIYYELTWQGQKLLHPETGTTFSVLLALSTAAAGGSIAMMGKALGWWWDQQGPRAGPEEALSEPEAADEEIRSDDSGEDGQQAGTAESSGSNETADADGTLEAPADDVMEGGDAADDSATGLFDDGFILPAAFFLTAILLFVLAMVLRYRNPRRPQ